jgi:hypothetical protein
MNMAEGWHVGRPDDSEGWKGGPYTWEQLLLYVGEGRLTPTDLVWHASMPDWQPAGQVPGLFATPASIVEEPPAAPAAPAASVSSPPRPRRGGLVVIIALLAVFAIGALAGGWWFLSRDGGSEGDDGPPLGVAEVSLPSRDSLVQTAEYGEVPANQVGVMLVDGAGRNDAEKLAGSLGGTVVGEIEFVNVYQIEFPGTSEGDILAALDTAAADENVETAFPNSQVELDAEIWGVRVDPYEDPIYGGGAGDGYKAIGVSKAWSYIKGAGIDLGKVHVGVTDDGLYRPGEGRESEFGGDVEINFPDPDAGELANPEVWDDGKTNPAGSHGTGVSTIIAGDPGNGGPSGVAGPLGKNLKLSVTNIFAGKYGDVTTKTPDPNDPSKYVAADGKTYAMGDLVALKNQVEAGATVINCSWGASDAHPGTVLVYKKFFEKMAADHPDVLFVCSGGNTGTALNGTRRFPSGLALPNMITVGAVDNDGKLASYASKASANYEVTLAAPGTKAVVGMKSEGGAERQDGTSFSAPHVTAAAAILKSINPKLTAGQIKEILVSTARTSLGEGDKKKDISAAVGGKVLALDAAVLKVINELRVAKGLPELDDETLEKMGVIDAVATTGEPGQYGVRGIVEAAGDKGTGVKIAVSGENYAIGGKTEQALSGAGEATWDVTLPKDEGVITVTRTDNGAASVITIENIDINGAWSGSFTITDVTITDEGAAEEEGCSAVLLDAMKGKALPMTMDVTCDEGGQGSAVVFIDVSSLGEGTSSEPQTWGLSYSGTTITFEPGGEGITATSATVSRSGENFVMKGSMTGGGPGWTMKAVFTLSKPDTGQ